MAWLAQPPTHRAILLSGARQVGKTTLLLQSIAELIAQGVKPEQILYLTFDHPLIKLAGLEGTLKVWEELRAPPKGLEYLFLDEIQYAKDWAVWLKHQTDFRKKRRIAVTGSSIPLSVEDRESGVGRWHTIKLPTLSFCEYLQIKGIPLPKLPPVSCLLQAIDWPEKDRIRAAESARPLVPHFHEYLLRGGFPQTALVEDVTIAQKLLREDIIDKVLKRDMTALFGVRRVLELEKVFLYLCLHDGGMLDLPTLCSALELKRPTVANFLDLLEAAHLIVKLPPYGYGKEVLRGRYKAYLADPAMAGSVLLKGRSLLEDETRLGAAVETAVLKHVLWAYGPRGGAFSYWRGKRDYEVDFVAEVQGKLIPFEVKYQQSVRPDDLKGQRILCQEKDITRACAVTRDANDFDVVPLEPADKGPACSLLKIPAPLACFWLSQMGQP
ncbi:MAG: hypothetical protein BWX88_01888 [Planctomycetes bacterium ADurb.Bin126]|nr:MAG: hypothetical protein BWX88_01888 [Planctomycetes bacterium ADurb.Bin126]